MKKVVECAFARGITPTVLFDDISFLITSGCRKETAELYEMMAEEIGQMPLPSETEEKIPAFWRILGSWGQIALLKEAVCAG